MTQSRGFRARQEAHRAVVQRPAGEGRNARVRATEACACVQLRRCGTCRCRRPQQNMASVLTCRNVNV